MSSPTLTEIDQGTRQFLNSLPDQHAPISATVFFQVLPESESEFLVAANRLAGETRKQEGCSWFSVDKLRRMPGQTDDHELVYVIIEHWETVHAFKTHQWSSPHILEFQRQVFGWVASLPDLKFNYGTLAKTLPFPTGPSAPDRFTQNVNENGELDGTVTDNDTGLIWFKNANFFGQMPWEAAMHAVQEIDSRIPMYGLSDGTVAGNWRVPNINELQSLLDLTIASGAAITPGAFDNLEAANYWSSTSVAAFPALGWYTATAVGPPVFDLKFNGMRIWPVRGHSNRVRQTGQTQAWDTFGGEIEAAGSGQDAEFAMSSGMPVPPARFQVNHLEDGSDDGTVTDLVTGLTWLKHGNPFGLLNWNDATAACGALHAGQEGHDYLKDGSSPGDWALPDVNELRSLEDYGQARPALARNHPFTDVNEGLIWSSTRLASAPNLARFLYGGIGSCVWDHTDVLMGVWPVRRN